MLSIYISGFKSGLNYFSALNNGKFFSTCKTISNLLNMSLEDYTDILVNEVIKHKFYEVDTCFLEGDIYLDVTFKLNNLSKEVYIERFKETFTEQLMLLVLGGV